MKRLAVKTCISTDNAMIKGCHIVHAVFESYKGLPHKLASISTKSDEWFRSHGRPAKSENPLASGNLSPVDHFIRYVLRFNAVEPGSGLMLVNRTHEALSAELSNLEVIDIAHVDLANDVINESSDVVRWFTRFDIKHATRPDLLAFEKDCDEAVDAILLAKSNARAELKKIELERTI